MSASTGSLSLYIVRHGERIDHVDKTWLDPNPIGIHDPPLTARGQQQSRHTGRFISDLIKERSASGHCTTDIIVYTSPFLRCVQTALDMSIGLCEKMKEEAAENGSSVRVRLEPGLCEWLAEDYFDEVQTTADRMIGRRLEEYAHNRDASGIFDWGYRPVDLQLPEFPEEFEELLRRFKRVVPQIIRENKASSNRRDTVIVLVTHGAGVNAALEVVKNTPTLLETGYCCLSRARLVNSAGVDRWVVDLEVSMAHLKKLESLGGC
ncbi:uncharacterized protein VTP21DRAFT_4118 [Calcarisporiella thermophila]|uniref:uncharacterized protein n=1 Tax=Calcarisporiella thermophila TaxID=911321 RepID=UPI003743E654